ncbi:MAG: HAMP domain-containing sensor histidine kinase, partial [Gammaproteobacteria bacterium]
MTTDTGTPLRGPPGAHAAALNRGRLQLILAQRPVLWAGNLGLQGCAVALLAAEHAPAPLLAWMLINVVLTTARIVSAARLRGRSWDDADIARWLRWQVAAAAAGGTIWGVGAWLFLHPQPPGTFLAFSVLLLGVSWGGAVALAPHYTAAFAWTVPFVGLAALRHATLDTSHASLLGTTTFAYLLFLLMTARNLNRAVSAKIVADAENVALLAAVSRARDDAVRASAEKTRFLAAISHDLRQPLYAARLFMDLQETQLTTAPQLSVHRRAQNALAALDDQFAALTDLARLDSGVLEPRVDDVALRPIIADLVAECRAVRTHHGAPGPTLQCRCADVVARTDAALFQRILRNLLDNALKFTERSSVTIDAR